MGDRNVKIGGIVVGEHNTTDIRYQRAVLSPAASVETRTAIGAPAQLLAGRGHRHDRPGRDLWAPRVLPMTHNLIKAPKRDYLRPTGVLAWPEQDRRPRRELCSSRGHVWSPLARMVRAAPLRAATRWP
jgi:hypothetical protein